jgi:hypothetical protein
MAVRGRALAKRGTYCTGRAQISMAMGKATRGQAQRRRGGGAAAVARARHGMAGWAANGHQVQTLMAHINPAHKGLTTLVPRSMTTLRAHSFAKWIAFITLECFK